MAEKRATQTATVIMKQAQPKATIVGRKVEQYCHPSKKAR